jgi:hypothetical protein
MNEEKKEKAGRPRQDREGGGGTARNRKRPNTTT